MYARVGRACRESFEQALQEAHGGQELPDEIRSQIPRVHLDLSHQMPPTAFPANASFAARSHSKTGHKAPKDNKFKRVLGDGAPVTFNELRQVQAKHAVAATQPVLSDGQLPTIFAGDSTGGRAGADT